MRIAPNAPVAALAFLFSGLLVACGERGVAAADATGPTVVLEARVAGGARPVPCTTNDTAVDGTAHAAPAGRPHASLARVESPSRPVLCAAVSREADALAHTARIARALRDSVSGSMLHERGRLELLWADPDNGDARAVSRAIEDFEAALVLAPERADILADLGAGLLVRGVRETNVSDLLASLDASSRALALSAARAPAESEYGATARAAAQVNRALVLTHLGLVVQAVGAWDSVITSAGETRDHAWQTSGRAQREALLAALSHASNADAVLRVLAPATNPDVTRARVDDSLRAPTDLARVRAWVFEQALPIWARAQLGDNRLLAARALAAADSASQRLVRAGLDSSARAAVVRLQQAGTHTQLLAEAHRDFGDGMAHVNRGEPAAAVLLFRRTPGLDTLSPTLNAWGALFESLASAAAQRPGDWLGVATRLAQEHATRTPALAGRAQLMRATLLLRQLEMDAAADALAAADTLLAASGEVEHRANVAALSAERAIARGDHDAGRTLIAQALQPLRHYPGSLWRHNALWVLAREAMREGWWYAADDILADDVAASVASPRPTARLEALVVQAMARQLRGDADGAAAVLVQVDRDLALLADSAARRWFGAEAAMVRLSGNEANAANAVNATATLRPALDSAIDVFTAAGRPYRRATLLLQRARAHLAAADTSASVQDLIDGVNGLRRAQQSHSDIGNDADVLAQLRATLDDVLLAMIRRGDAPSAMAIIDLLRDRDATPRAAHHHVAFLVTHDTLVARVDAPSGTSWRVAPLARDAFARELAQARVQLEMGDDTALQRRLASIYSAVIGPVADLLPTRGEPLLLTLDEPLADVPFAALADPERGEPLMERVQLRYTVPAPTAGSRRSSTRLDARSRALFLAHSRVDRARYPWLADLPDARGEVLEAADRWPLAVTLLDSASTRPRVLDALAESNVVHIASHALLDARRPARSRVLLNEWELSADDIRRLDLRHVRLVILSACESARQGSGHGRGLAGLAGAFHTAGADGVMGALWRVDDRATRALMGIVHEQLADGVHPAKALQTAQRTLRASTDPRLASPAAWGAFTYAGALPAAVSPSPPTTRLED